MCVCVYRETQRERDSVCVYIERKRERERAFLVAQMVKNLPAIQEP